MNICIVTKFDCSYEEFTAMLAEVGDDVRRCTSAWEVTKMNDNTAVGLLNVTDMEGLQNVMSSPKVQEWNAANNAVADVYALEKISSSTQRSEIPSNWIPTPRLKSFLDAKDYASFSPQNYKRQKWLNCQVPI